MPPTIECCLHNLDAGDRAALATLGAVSTAPCLGHCDTCRTDSFAVVDGELVTDADRAAIVEQR